MIWMLICIDWKSTYSGLIYQYCDVDQFILSYNRGDIYNKWVWFMKLTAMNLLVWGQCTSLECMQGI